MIRAITAQVVSFLAPRTWVLDDLWIRVPTIRRRVLAAALRPCLDPDARTLRDKIDAIDGIIERLRRDQSLSRFFPPSGAHGPEPGPTSVVLNALPTTGMSRRFELRNPHIIVVRRVRRFIDAGLRLYRRVFSRHVVPDESLREHLQSGLMEHGVAGVERWFDFQELAIIDRRLLRLSERKPGRQRTPVFEKTRIAEFKGLLAPGIMARPVPASYIAHYFPGFTPEEFIRGGAAVHEGRRPLFSITEVIALERVLVSRLRARNRASRLQRAVPLLKMGAIVALCLWVALPLAFDTGILLYGFAKNRTAFSAVDSSRKIASPSSPYVVRANRVFRMLEGAVADNFNRSGPAPVWPNRFAIDGGARLHVELNYGVYRALRVQDQTGLTVIAIDDRKLAACRTADRDRYGRLAELIAGRPLAAGLAQWIARITGGRIVLHDPANVRERELRAKLPDRIAAHHAPLEFIRSANDLCACVTVVYHKPNTQKWSPLDGIPDIMKKAVVIREDRRFYNRLFPIPHRGNDNLVIVPQIAKKGLRDFLEWAHRVCARNRFDRLAKIAEGRMNRLTAVLNVETRGGSSIANQVVELLFTKFIPEHSRAKTPIAGMIEQKKHELPASLALAWHWSRDEILEAYVNEIYGGHLYSDIRGFQSQAEIYFSRPLAELTLREQMMLVGAIKKPSRIKELAQWQKAAELAALVEKTPGGADSRAVRDWTAANALYKVDPGNYREYLAVKLRAREWIDRRTNRILDLLLADGAISRREHRAAMAQRVINFNFAPPIVSLDTRLVNNIKRELDAELGPGRSDSGAIVVTTIDAAMQASLQSIINTSAGHVYVDPDNRAEGQPAVVRIDGGARIIRANEMRGDAVTVVNRILADVGGSSAVEEEWDWITQANRSLGSSLKPLLVLYFLLEGYHLSDELRNTSVTYANYTLEQQLKFLKFARRYPDRRDDIADIEKHWLWTPKNYRDYSDEWITVRRALANSVNSIHVQIQEIVTPDAFARLLNETMNITDERMRHKPFRSIILGGSSGDQRYDRFLLAFSLFANDGVIRKHTYLRSLLLPNGARLVPDYRLVRCPILERFGRERVRAAANLVNLAMRDAVTDGSMTAMNGIGAGKTGTSNELKDALATAHFVAGGDTYIVGVRLGNKQNHSIGMAAAQIATPVAERIVRTVFDRASVVRGNAYDEYLLKKVRATPHIVESGRNFFLSGEPPKSRRFSIAQMQRQTKDELAREALAHFKKRDYEEAAEAFERLLRIASWSDLADPAYRSMVECYRKLKNQERAGQIAELIATAKTDGAILERTGSLAEIVSRKKKGRGDRED